LRGIPGLIAKKDDERFKKKDEFRERWTTFVEALYEVEKYHCTQTTFP